MSRRSRRLISTGYYQGDEDSSNGGSSLSEPLDTYKDSALRTFRKKSSSIKRASPIPQPSTHTSSYYTETVTYINSGREPTARTSSFLEQQLEKDSHWETDLFRKRLGTDNTYSSSTNGVSDTKTTYDVYGSSSGYSSEEDYTGHFPLDSDSSGSGFKSWISWVGSLLWLIVTSPGKLFGLLYWWIGTTWYRLTTSASLLDVFILTRHSSILKKAVLILLLLACICLGIWYLYPLALGLLRSSPSVISSGAKVSPASSSWRMEDEEAMNTALLVERRLLPRLESLESRFQALATDLNSFQREERVRLEELVQGQDERSSSGTRVHREETLSLLEGLVSRREAALREDLRKDGTIQLQNELLALRQERRKDLQGLMEKIEQISQVMEAQMLQMKLDWKRQEDQKENTLQDLSLLKEQLVSLRRELGAIMETQRGMSERMNSFTGQIRGMRDEVETQFPQWVHRLLLQDGGGGESLSGIFVQQENMERQLIELERRILAGVLEEQKRSSERSAASIGSVLQGGGVTEEQVHAIVARALGRYSEDRIGLVDYALESSGASVLSTRCSETYETKTALLSLFGIPLWYQSQSPRVILQPDTNPGNCWAFRGSQGFAVVRLSSRIHPTSVTLDHISKSLSPKRSISSAPKEFAVFGLDEETVQEGTLLGKFTYNKDGDPIQTFQLQEKVPAVYQIVELRILSNWGHPEYTCIYRFRVHGEPEE
ncbi:SUN domain-containing protein 2 [Microcaecilia unicolor]|uniref:SUN domain-containing protein 2 n=1 Tax=Microcaecilia unicolor TaxID=1415580 RepID=A0A6P7YPP4_9AMPH|nr:SUN domain-containing protein 2 [Microcaecilia unicolor]XP_030066689.1 SUN domain-containing protein 2 [Microcaecilia unicolor]XP_030066696.1 SUN domain-containing protein 2 [Microcaecilia unicolor]XP_030066703.1 SUN domain-containing protein 2 [Microcaecilia unicolor]